MLSMDDIYLIKKLAADGHSTREIAQAQDLTEKRS